MRTIKYGLLALCWLIAGAVMAAVDVNTASANDLDSIKGIGPSTAAKIMAARKQAPFKDWKDFILRLNGLGEKRAAKLSAEGLTVNGAAYKPNALAGIDRGTQQPNAPGAPARSRPIAIAPRH